MNCTTARDRLPELLLAPCARAEDADLRAHLAACPDCRSEQASLQRALDALEAAPGPPPSPRLRQAVRAAIEAAKRAQRAALAQPSRRARPALAPFARRPWRRLLLPLAAAGLVALGFIAGRRSSSPASSLAATPIGTDAANRQDIARLNARLDAMSQVIASSLLPQRPGNERLQRVLAEGSAAPANRRVAAGLVESLALDPSVNVRLSALDALYAHADDPTVRASVVACLNREPSPLVQVAMIDFLVGARDRDATPEIRKLAADDKTDLDVRESARRALDQL
jgi:hypothetical protein